MSNPDWINTAPRICPMCGGKQWVGVEYSYPDRHHFDGISEWHCFTCNRRFGRWTGRELAEGESEPPYGGMR